MSRLEKLRRKVRRNPRAIRFSELLRVLRDLGYEESRRQGSHYVYRPQGPGPSILIVKPHGGRTVCSEVDVKKVIELLEQTESGHE